MDRDLNAVFHFWEDFMCQNGLSRIRKDYPTTGVLKSSASCYLKLGYFSSMISMNPLT